MNKINWIDLTRHTLSGGDTPSELRGAYHPRVVEKLLSLAFDTLLDKNIGSKDNWREEMGHYDWMYDTFTKFFTQPILHDEGRDRYYAELPKPVISINNNNGIRLLFPEKEEQSAFIPVSQNDLFLSDGLDVGQLTGLIYFNLEGRKLMLSGDINCNWKQVSMKLALGFEELEDNDDVNIPDGLSIQVFDMVRQILRDNPPQDIENDSAAQQTTK